MKRSPLKRGAEKRQNEPPVKMNCKVCGKEFTRYASQVRWRGASYCSSPCKHIGMAATTKQRACEWCGKDFKAKNTGTIGTGKFCSRQCFFSKQKSENPRSRSTKCQTCGREFVVFAAHQKRGSGKFCSRECLGVSRQRPGSSGHRGSGWLKIRKEIRLRDGGCCVRCGGDDGSKALAVDHVIPWILMKSCESRANDGVNLASLCMACHGYKTMFVEPALLKGDIMGLISFYGRERTDAALRNWESSEVR